MINNKIRFLYLAPLLNQLQLVTLPQTAESMETIDPNHISVEIMRDNISLLEGIAAGEDSTLENVNVYDSLNSKHILNDVN